MARRTPKPDAQFSTTLTPLRKACEQCGNRLWVAYHCRRKVVTLQGVYQLRVIMSQCHTFTYAHYHVRYHRRLRKAAGHCLTANLAWM